MGGSGRFRGRDGARWSQPRRGWACCPKGRSRAHATDRKPPRSHFLGDEDACRSDVSGRNDVCNRDELLAGATASVSTAVAPVTELVNTVEETASESAESLPVEAPSLPPVEVELPLPATPPLQLP